MAANASQTGQRGVSRVLTKLENSIASGNYYEAHQMYRTLYFRYVGQGKYKECLELLYNGAMRMIANDQDTSASDLGLLLIDTLEKANDSVNVEEWISSVVTLIGNIKATTVERETLIQRAIKWSADVSGITLGHPLLHRHLGQIFWEQNNIEQSRHHFLLCRDGKICGHMLAKISESKGYSGEVDLFIVQAVLQQLCVKERKTAEETFASYVKHHSQIKKKEWPFKKPLLNFIHFVFRSIESNNFAAFQKLRELYKPSLNRDPSFEKYLLKIATLYFGAAVPQSAPGDGLMGGMFGDIFSQLFQDLNDDDDNGEYGESTAGARGNIGDGPANELD